MGEKARAIHPAAWLVYTVHQRVLDKLRRQPVEDYRIDFEDGYGSRSNDEEDRHAVQAAEETVSALAARSLPPYFGIRIKPLHDALRGRGTRTLELYLTRLLARTAGVLPAQFVVTLPKVHSPGEVEVLTRAVQDLEQRLGLAPRSIRIELMVDVLIKESLAVEVAYPAQRVPTYRQHHAQ